MEESLRKRQTDYLGLVLIHQCLSDYYGAYRALEDLYDEDKIRAIGISNFSAERMKQNLDIFGFELTANEMEQLKALDENKSMWAEYDNPMIAQYAMAEE